MITRGSKRLVVIGINRQREEDEQAKRMLGNVKMGTVGTDKEESVS